MSNWFWNIFVLKLGWLDYCRECQKYKWPKHVSHGVCAWCYHKIWDEYLNEGEIEDPRDGQPISVENL